MNNNKKLGIYLLVAGIVLLLLSLTADLIGIGGAPGFGFKQIAGVIIGVIVAVVGFVLNSRK